ALKSLLINIAKVGVITHRIRKLLVKNVYVMSQLKRLLRPATALLRLEAREHAQSCITNRALYCRNGHPSCIQMPTLVMASLSVAKVHEPVHFVRGSQRWRKRPRCFSRYSPCERCSLSDQVTCDALCPRGI